VEEAPRGPSKRLNCSCDLKNRRTLLRGAEERLAIERDPVKIVNIVYVMEEAASFFFRRAVNGLRQKRKEMQITEDYERAARIASSSDRDCCCGNKPPPHAIPPGYRATLFELTSLRSPYPSDASAVHSATKLSGPR
jgi:hypothetical protein